MSNSTDNRKACSVVIGAGKAAHGGLKFVLKPQSQPDGDQQEVETPLEKSVEKAVEKAVRRIALKTSPAASAKGASGATPTSSSEKSKKVEVSPNANSDVADVSAEISPNESNSETPEKEKEKKTKGKSTPKAKPLKNGVPAKRGRPRKIQNLEGAEATQKQAQETDQKTDQKAENSSQNAEDEDDDEPKKKKRKPKAKGWSNKSTKKQKTANDKTERKESSSDGANDKEEKSAEKQENDSAAKAEIEDALPPPKIKPNLHQYSAFQLLCDYLLRVLQKKDPLNLFYFPVTEKIAPDYNKLITQPMDFYTVRKKIEENSYETLLDFKNDITLLCSNAMQYNEPSTEFYLTAMRLQSVINQLINRDKIFALSKHLSFIRTIPSLKLGFELPEDTSRLPAKAKKTNHALLDNMTADEIVAQVKAASERVAAKLAARKPQSNMGFLGQKEDGSVSMHFLNSSSSTASAAGPVSLGQMIGELKEGNPGISLFTEDRRNIVIPVQSLDYGSYASFAPVYDSTWATLSKEKSNFLLSTYGDQTSTQYALSLQRYLSNTDDYLMDLCNGLLDQLTNGEHSKAIAQLEGKPIPNGNNSQPNDGAIDFDSLRSLSSLGIDVSFIDDIAKKLTPQPTASRGKTDSKSILLKNLATLQKERLSQPPPFSLGNVPEASENENILARQFVEAVKDSVAEVAPGSLVTPSPLRKLMGAQTSEAVQQKIAAVAESRVRNAVDQESPDDIDLDVLREFLALDEDGFENVE